MQAAAVPHQIVFGSEYQGGFWINRFVPSIQQYGFFAVTEKYEQEHDCAYLVITHDLQIASRLCEVIYEIEHGKITKKAVR